MSMLPFATRTDMVDALNMSDTRLSDVDSSLATLLAEHDAPGARAQLKTLWFANVRSLLGGEDDATPAAPAAGEGAGVGHGAGAVARRQVAPTPLDSPREAGNWGGNGD